MILCEVVPQKSHSAFFYPVSFQESACNISGQLMPFHHSDLDDILPRIEDELTVLHLDLVYRLFRNDSARLDLDGVDSVALEVHLEFSPLRILEMNACPDRCDVLFYYFRQAFALICCQLASDPDFVRLEIL